MVKISIDLSGVRKKVSKDNFDRGRYSMMNQMLSDMQPFVPSDRGILQQTGTIGVDKKSLHWVTPYANSMYRDIITNAYGSFPVRNWSTPGTGPYWDQKAKGLFLSDWINVFSKGAGF